MATHLVTPPSISSTTPPLHLRSPLSLTSALLEPECVRVVPNLQPRLQQQPEMRRVLPHARRKVVGNVVPHSVRHLLAPQLLPLAYHPLQPVHRCDGALTPVRLLSSSPHSSAPAIPSSLLVPHPPGSPLDRYVQELRAGELRPDIRQEKTMRKLQSLWEQIEQWDPAPSSPPPSPSPSPTPHSGGGGLFSFARSLFSRSSPSSSSSISSLPPPSLSSTPKGLYLYGGVGCGKTMMMDLFYHSLSSPHKAREHFHSFMLDIHARLHHLRQSGPSQSNPLPLIAAALSSTTHILCLDEFQVTDVADAMILRLLFTSLWQQGVVVVATSNRPPSDLYKNGINRDVFVPFIAELQRHCDVHAMDAGQDHRLLGTVDQGVYHYPLDERAEAQMQSIFHSLSKAEPTGPSSIRTATGRTIPIPLASKQAALFSFHDLCELPLGAADYDAIARAYQYVLVSGVPLMRSNERDKVRRFITLLDVLYDRGTRLIVSAEAKPSELFRDEDGKVIRGGEGAYDEQFASSRAVSRLIEMQSTEYYHRHQQRNEASTPDA